MDEKEYIESRGFNINSLRPLHKIIKLGPSLKPSETYSTDKPMFYAVKRGNNEDSIDMQLLKQAESLGVEFKLCKSMSFKDADIIATGARFMNGMGYGHHYSNVNIDDEAIIFLLGDKYAPKGYAYAIPYGKNEVSIVVTSFEPTSFNQMPSFFKRLVEEVPTFSKLVDGADKGPAFAKIGFFNIPNTAQINKRLIVGEAAGFVEADRGFGMHYALESGFLSGQALSEGKDYDQLWKASFRSQLLKAFRRRLALNRLNDSHYDKLINAGAKMSIDEYMKYKKAQNKNIAKQFLLDIYTMNEVAKLRRKFNIIDFD